MKWRTWHAYVGLVAALPLLVIVVTGLILQLRNQFEGIQPKTVTIKLVEGKSALSMEEVLAKFPQGNVEQIIYRPRKGNYSVRLKDGSEVQMHPQTGEVVKDSPRRSGFLIDIHQGSWLGPLGQYVVHFGAGLSLIFLLFSGVLLFPFRRWSRS
jgi:uncharacterized iron-regulated membrane protein